MGVPELLLSSRDTAMTIEFVSWPSLVQYGSNESEARA